MRVRANDDDDLGRSDDAHYAVPVRRSARLQQLRLHRLGRSGGPGAARTVWVDPDWAHLRKLVESGRPSATLASRGGAGPASRVGRQVAVGRGVRKPPPSLPFSPLSPPVSPPSFRSRSAPNRSRMSRAAG